MNNEKNKKVWLKKCEETLKLGGKSDITAKNYRYAIKRFLNYYPDNTKIDKLSIEKIIKYLQKNFLNKNLSGSTYNSNLSAIRYFYLICFERDINRTLLPSSKIRKRIPTIISKEKFITIINNEDNLEHKCWFLLSFCCGLRISEIATLKIENINSKEHKIKVIGKRDKERYTILPDVVIKFLRLYYKERKFKCSEGYLFKGYELNEHISPRTIGNCFTSLKKAYNLPGEITEHSLRHSFATYYLINGGDLLTLKSMLGHKSLNTTSIYLHLSQDFNNLKGINYEK